MHTSFKIEGELLERVKALLSGTQTVSQFAYDATEEKANRMEARSERARIQLATRDKKLLAPIISDILKDMGLL
jgi:hypothetical protein